MKYYLYIIKTVKDTYYCGIALDVLKRFDEHLNSKKGAKYTKAYKPLCIVYVDCFGDKSSALKEEIRIKALKKEQKLELIQKNEEKTKNFLKKFHDTIDK